MNISQVAALLLVILPIASSLASAGGVGEYNSPKQGVKDFLAPIAMNGRAGIKEAWSKVTSQAVGQPPDSPIAKEEAANYLDVSEKLSHASRLQSAEEVRANYKLDGQIQEITYRVNFQDRSSVSLDFTFFRPTAKSKLRLVKVEVSP